MNPAPDPTKPTEAQGATRYVVGAIYLDNTDGGLFIPTDDKPDAQGDIPVLNFDGSTGWVHHERPTTDEMRAKNLEIYLALYFTGDSFKERMDKYFASPTPTPAAPGQWRNDNLVTPEHEWACKGKNDWEPVTAGQIGLPFHPDFDYRIALPPLDATLAPSGEETLEDRLNDAAVKMREDYKTRGPDYMMEKANRKEGGGICAPQQHLETDAPAIQIPSGTTGRETATNAGASNAAELSLRFSAANLQRLEDSISKRARVAQRSAPLKAMINNAISKNQSKGVLFSEQDQDLMQICWFIDNEGYARKAWISAHQAVAVRMGLEHQDGVIDHRNGNPKDNRRDNLRIITQRKNIRNLHRSRSNTGYIGVYAKKQKGGVRFVAELQARKDGVKIKLYRGVFDTPEEAARAYDEAAKKHGFETRNFPTV